MHFFASASAGSSAGASEAAAPCCQRQAGAWTTSRRARVSLRLCLRLEQKTAAQDSDLVVLRLNRTQQVGGTASLSVHAAALLLVEIRKKTFVQEAARLLVQCFFFQLRCRRLSELIALSSSWSSSSSSPSSSPSPSPSPALLLPLPLPHPVRARGDGAGGGEGEEDRRS